MKLAAPLKIRSLTAQNRFAALPMEANDAEPDGRPSPRTIERYRALARGRWGIIFIEAVALSETGRSRNRQLVLTARNVPDFTRLTDAIRETDDRTIVIIQINHAGRYALKPAIAYRHPLLDGWKGIDAETPVLTEKQLDTARDELAAAAANAARVGAHGADVKCCHGYLAAELLRPANTRRDSYGGPLENRLRLVGAMLEAIKPAVDAFDFLAGSRISLFEGIDGGLGGDGSADAPLSAEIRALAELLMRNGASWICETAGNPYLNPEMVRPTGGDTARFDTMALHHRLASRVKREFPDFAVVGTGYTLFGRELVDTAEKNLASGGVDVIGLGRQNFADPETPKKILDGEIGAVRWCAACPKNNCSHLLRNSMEAGCVIHDKYYKEQLKALRDKEKNKARER